MTVVDGNINSQKYTDILDNNLWPVIANVFPVGQWICKDDNAPPGFSKCAGDPTISLFTFTFSQVNFLSSMGLPTIFMFMRVVVIAFC